MNRMLVAATAALCVASLGGCSLIASFQDRIGSAVARYCEVPQQERAALREAINARTDPNSVEVNCAGDVPVPAASGG